MTDTPPDTYTLSQLFLIWHQVHGMKAAMLTAAPILCVHLDRLEQQAQGQLVKNQTAVVATREVHVPCFDGEHISTELVTYVLVAISAHLGQDGAGHYRNAHRVVPSVTADVFPFQWLITEDGSSPALAWNCPNWLLQNSTTFWLLREDCLQLPHYELSRVASDEGVATAGHINDIMTQLMERNEQNAADSGCSSEMR